MIRNQHIMGASGPVDLNLIPVFEVMNRRGVKDWERCLNLLRMVYDLDIKRLYRDK